MTNPNNMEGVPTLPISDEDIYEAMKEISGYLDITGEARRLSLPLSAAIKFMGSGTFMP